MTMQSRLETIAPEVAKRFWQASSTRRRQAALRACEHVTMRLGLTGRAIEQALAVMRGTTAPTGSLRVDLERLAGELDDEYFRINEESKPHQENRALEHFSRARAASSLAFALSPNDTQLHEAIYEAIMAVNDPNEIIRIVEAALS